MKYYYIGVTNKRLIMSGSNPTKRRVDKDNYSIPLTDIEVKVCAEGKVARQGKAGKICYEFRLQAMSACISRVQSCIGLDIRTQSF